MPIEYKVCFICSKQCIEHILAPKNNDLFSSIFRKFIPNVDIPTFFKKLVVELNQYGLLDSILLSHCITLTSRVIDFRS